MASGGISGVAVALASAGGVLLYAGFQGQSPLEALRDITSGKTKALETDPVTFTNDPSNLGQGGSGVFAAVYGGTSGGIGGRIAAAAMNHKNERYSQAKRWQTGYSDCSSFVGKALKDCGITPPGGSTTLSYSTWSKLRTISRDKIQTGDILCGPGHVAIALDGTRAIGQQSSKRNVRVDAIDSIMFGQPSWVARRMMAEESGAQAGTGAGSYAA
jgi:cell wall-associated NlpC family hydrolase